VSRKGRYTCSCGMHTNSRILWNGHKCMERAGQWGSRKAREVQRKMGKGWDAARRTSRRVWTAAGLRDGRGKLTDRGVTRPVLRGKLGVRDLRRGDRHGRAWDKADMAHYRHTRRANRAENRHQRHTGRAAAARVPLKGRYHGWRAGRAAGWAPIHRSRAADAQHRVRVRYPVPARPAPQARPTPKTRANGNGRAPRAPVAANGRTPPRAPARTGRATR
jgi:hypothetical protein